MSNSTNENAYLDDMKTVSEEYAKSRINKLVQSKIKIERMFSNACVIILILSVALISGSVFTTKKISKLNNQIDYLREKVKELGQEYTTRQYLIQILISYQPKYLMMFGWLI